MHSKSLSQIVLLAVSIASSSVIAEDGILGQKLTLPAIAANALEARAGIAAGEFEYFIVKSDIDEGIQWEQNGLFAYDDRLELTLHAFVRRTKAAMDRSLAKERSVDFWGGGVYPLTESPYIHVPKKGLGGKPLQDFDIIDSSFVSCRPFEYRSFGFGYYADITRHSRFDELIAAHLTSDGMRSLDGQEIKGIRTTGKGMRAFNIGGCLMAIDTNRGFWPIDHHFDYPTFKRDSNNKLVLDKTELQSSCHMELKEMSGHWVPSEVEYGTRKWKFKITLDWKKLNPPPDALWISQGRVQAWILDSEKKIIRPDAK